jgi:hypothetical protein
MIEYLQTWSFFMSGNNPIGADVVLMLMLIMAALTQWFAVGVSGAGTFHWRTVAAMGWTLWASRFIWSLLVGDDPIIPPISSVAIALVAIGATLRNMRDSSCLSLGKRRGR